ncbi:MAG: ABC transporter substrate-binding protein [Bacteroidetes bacterium]|nr:ABC transporter substrate-binding protein [Bacteroidota bacterium]
MNFIRIPIYIFFFILLAFTSCNETQKSDLKIFYYNEDAGITSLDPAFAKDQSNIWAVAQLFNGLIQLDSQLKVQPCIAKNWTISSDGLLYTFSLNSNVYFHDDACFGKTKRKIIADDVVYSFKRLVSSETASPGSWVFNDKTNTESFKALNDSTFTITLTKSFPPLLGLLSMPYCFVIPQEAITFYGKDFRSHPVGTGPFQFKTWQEGNRLVLIKNQNYFEQDINGKQLPHLDGVIVSFMESKQAAFFEFIKGKLDFVNGLESSFKDEILTHQGSLKSKYHDQFKLVVGPYLNTEYMGMIVDDTAAIVKNSPFKNIKFRQAINLAIDRKKMIAYLRNGIGVTNIDGFVPTSLLAANKNLQELYNPTYAKQLVKESGYKGESIKINTTKNYIDLTIFIQHELEAIGIKSTIEINPGSAHRDMVSKSKLNFFRASWIADYPDAENYLSLFYSKNFCPTGPNTTHYKNAQYDKLYEQAMLTANDSIRQIFYQQMNTLVANDCPVITLFYDQSIRLVQNKISGLETNPLNLLVLKNVIKTD